MAGGSNDIRGNKSVFWAPQLCWFTSTFGKWEINLCMRKKKKKKKEANHGKCSFSKNSRNSEKTRHICSDDRNPSQLHIFIFSLTWFLRFFRIGRGFFLYFLCLAKSFFHFLRSSLATCFSSFVILKIDFRGSTKKERLDFPWDFFRRDARSQSSNGKESSFLGNYGAEIAGIFAAEINGYVASSSHSSKSWQKSLENISWEDRQKSSFISRSSLVLSRQNAGIEKRRRQRVVVA